MKKILTIVGARPQFIKAAAISHTIREKYADCIAEDILHTGQHYDDSMSGRFFTELDIPQPRYNLGVGSGSHGAQTAAMLKGIEDILLSEHYDGVLIYGDTNSTLAGALAAAKLHVPVYHVEAGLRSFNRDMPEEINRIVADHVSTLLFAPTNTAVQNLWNEGFTKEQVVFSGDVMLDNVMHYSKNEEFVSSEFGVRSSELSGCGSINSELRTPNSELNNSPFILATVHRDFNTDNSERLKNILSALNAVAKKRKTKILFPIHPRTRNKLESLNIHLSPLTFHLVEPLSYLETLAALRRARLVLTDSGGLQKEAYFSGKSCVVLRPETEWVEIVNAGAAVLADADESRIVEGADWMWDNVPPEPKEFGDGHAAEHILEHIIG